MQPAAQAVGAKPENTASPGGTKENPSRQNKSGRGGRARLQSCRKGVKQRPALAAEVPRTPPLIPDAKLIPVQKDPNHPPRRRPSPLAPPRTRIPNPHQRHPPRLHAGPPIGIGSSKAHPRGFRHLGNSVAPASCRLPLGRLAPQRRTPDWIEVQRSRSRGAAKECSPRRKPWVPSRRTPQVPEGRKRILLDETNPPEVEGHDFSRAVKVSNNARL